MVAEYLVLGTSVALAKDAVSIEYLKSKHLELSDEEKQAFMEDGNRRFVHFTSKNPSFFLTLSHRYLHIIIIYLSVSIIFPFSLIFFICTNANTLIYFLII